MNKLSFSLALFFLVFAACSDDKETRADICKKGPSKECLTGKWKLNGIKDIDNITGSLVLDDNGAEYTSSECGEILGRWEVNGVTLTITYNDVIPNKVSGEIILTNDGAKMNIKNSVVEIDGRKYPTVARCFHLSQLPSIEEELTYIGAP